MGRVRKIEPGAAVFAAPVFSPLKRSPIHLASLQRPNCYGGVK